MGKKCSFCKSMIREESVFEVCQNCGYEIWGEKMFKTIVANMENARDVGDLYQGSVSRNVGDKNSLRKAV